jgi:hypothetical protein
MYILILIIHRLWKNTRIRLLTKFWQNRTLLLILHRCDIPAIAAGARHSGLFSLHVADSRCAVGLWSSGAAAVLGALF